MATVKMQQHPSSPGSRKQSGKYNLLVTFSTGESRSYWSLPAKVASNLQGEGWKMRKISYFDWEGEK